MKMLKRKFIGQESVVNKYQKMSTSIVVPESGHLRNLPFKLTDQTAKKNLIAGAKRKHFEKDPKQKSMKILFSAGAYLKVVCRQPRHGMISVEVHSPMEDSTLK